jgi:hypothetical protein
MYTLHKPVSSLFKSPQIFRIAASTVTRSAATIKSLDHLVITVKSIPKSIQWYTQNLGMRSESFISAANPDITRHSLTFGSQKINLHELGNVRPFVRYFEILNFPILNDLYASFVLYMKPTSYLHIWNKGIRTQSSPRQKRQRRSLFPDGRRRERGAKTPHFR